MYDPAEEYKVVSWSDLYKGNWLVIRKSTLTLMTEGSIWDVTRWMKVWAPVSGNKRGTDLSSEAKRRMIECN